MDRHPTTTRTTTTTTSTSTSTTSTSRFTRRIALVVGLLVASVAVAVPAQPASAYTTVYFNGAGSAPRVLLIGDSSLAGVRWNGGAYDPMKIFNFSFDAESCRRTTTTSCGGREGIGPTTR